ncbi:Suprabasin like [Actinidia chinensis var. chinensis]|uniref:Suprabasin like n=1 Tax=Actinidia chinensis var. chinensis TaxID=1590841 RepID=A0A2R6RG62_ACTCC|nr:Suprabasin like [Actinidia chinensis var. chinensis]
MIPPSLHSKFFSSLKQVEKRLKLENPSQPSTFSSPPPQKTNKHRVDEIGLLIQLLVLSDCEENEQKRVGLGLKNCGGTCGHECGFYAKIVGVKGPKCGKEVERLERWIKHFLSNGGEGKREPLRLAHLLLGKAVFCYEGSDGSSGFEFSSTVEEFLENDPPED